MDTTAEEQRTMRRVQRRMTVRQRQHGLRILRHAAAQLERGKTDQAVRTVVNGFGGLFLRALLDTSRHAD